MSVPDRRTRERLREILLHGEYEIPVGQGFGGTGGPGLFLEHLLGLKTSNIDVPDAGAWEVKFSSGNSLVTLFHKEALPRGQAMRYMIQNWGWIGRNELQSFRHTICSKSDQFEVVDDANEIRVRKLDGDDLVPHWPHDVLITAFARKLANLILVRGKRRGQKVTYQRVEYLSNARTTQLIRSIVDGTICIDFDAYIRQNGSIRNHGTKFRIKIDDLRTIYADRTTER